MIYSRSPGWQTPQEQKNVSPGPYPWRKLYSCKNKTFLGPTFPFPWSSGLSSLAALGRQLSCRSRKVKSCPSESLVLTWIHSFRGKERGIYILRAFLLLWKIKTKKGKGRAKMIKNTAHCLEIRRHLMPNSFLKEATLSSWPPQRETHLK